MTDVRRVDSKFDEWTRKCENDCRTKNLYCEVGKIQ